MSKIKVKSVLADAGEPMATAEFDVGGNWLESEKKLHPVKEVSGTPAFAPVPTVTVARMEDAGQTGLEPSMGADFVPPGVAAEPDQMAEQTVWAAWAPLALVRVRAKRAAPERARSLTKKVRNLRIAPSRVAARPACLDFLTRMHAAAPGP